MKRCLPYAIPGLVHMDSMEFPVNLYYKSMYYSIWIPWKSPHQIPWKNPLNGPSKILPILEIKPPSLNHALDWSHASECWQMLMLNLGAINNLQHSSSTTTIIHKARPRSPTAQGHLMVTMPNIVTMHSKSSPSVPFADIHSRCHVATKQSMVDLLFVIDW